VCVCVRARTCVCVWVSEWDHIADWQMSDVLQRIKTCPWTQENVVSFCVGITAHTVTMLEAWVTLQLNDILCLSWAAGCLTDVLALIKSVHLQHSAQCALQGKLHWRFYKKKLHERCCITGQYTELCKTGQYTELCITGQYMELCKTGQYTELCNTEQYTELCKNV
jgi:hypothetical protein